MGIRKASCPRYINPMNRRESLAAIASLGSTLIPSLAVEPSNPIVEVNKKLGTKDWMLSKTAIDPKTNYRAVGIEGYVSHSRIAVGDTLTFHINTNPASKFTIDIYRMGYYGGTAGRHVKNGSSEFCVLFT